MSDTPPSIDPIDALIAQMEAKMAKIQTAIEALRAVRGEFSVSGSVPMESLVRATDTTSSGKSDWENDATLFRSMTIPEATIKLLKLADRPLKNPEIAQYLQNGGLIMNSESAVNTVGSILTRRYQKVGDIQKHGRGTWVLREWSRASGKPRRGLDLRNRELIPEPPALTIRDLGMLEEGEEAA